MTRGKTHKFLRRLFALPFLPAEYIEPVFNSIDCFPGMNASLKKLLDYIRTTWISSTVHPPATWSVFNGAIRTNNNCEGWHRRLNSKLKKNHLPLYPLIDLCAKEAARVPVVRQLIDDDKIQRQQRLSSMYLERELFKIFDKMIAGDLSATQMLSDV